jgi:hypothetical protein
MRKPVRSVSQIAVLLLAGALGFAAGAYKHHLDAGGYLVKWSSLPHLPIVPAQFIPAGFGAFQVLAADGSRYGLTSSGWQLTATPLPSAGPPSSTQECDRSGPPFSSTNDPPDDIDQCVQIHYSMLETGMTLVVVTDHSGGVHTWQHRSDLYENLFQTLCYPPLGAFLAIGIAFVVQELIRGWPLWAS